jgi:hypothetical protein
VLHLVDNLSIADEERRITHSALLPSVGGRSSLLCGYNVLLRIYNVLSAVITMRRQHSLSILCDASVSAQIDELRALESQLIAHLSDAPPELQLHIPTSDMLVPSAFLGTSTLRNDDRDEELSRILSELTSEDCINGTLSPADDEDTLRRNAFHIMQANIQVTYVSITS